MNYKFASWDGAKSPYGLPVPIVYGVAWVGSIQVYSGEQFNWHNGTSTRTATASVYVPVYTVDDQTGAVSIEEKQQTCQSAVLVLCEHATTILDILKDGISINTGMLDATPVTTVTQRLRMISGRTPQLAGVVPPTGEEHGYFHGGTGSATAHTRFSRTANLGPAPYTYSSVARVDLCALGIGSLGSRHTLKFKVQGELAASATVGADPVDVLEDLWSRAGMTAALDTSTYYAAYVGSGGGSGSTEWVVNRSIENQTSARDLIESLLLETFSTAVTLEDGTVQIVPRDVGDVSATALGVNDFVIDGASDPISCTRKQDSDAFNCFPVSYTVTTDSGSHDVMNEDTTFAVANPSAYGVAGIHRAPPVSCSWVSTAEHALNLSHLLAQESFTVRRTFKFRLHPRWVLLQVGDTVSLTDPHLGLSSQVARIVSLSEDESGVIEVEAEEWFGAVAYTTPAVDPFDGFTPMSGNPEDPVSDAVEAMADDGFLTPVEKPAFFQAVLNVWHAVREGGDAGSGDIVIHGTDLNSASLAFHDYLNLSLGFDYGWVDIDRVWTTAGDRAAQRALLATWMAETTTVVAADYRAAFGAVETAIVDARSSVLKPAATGSTTPRTLMERFAESANVLDHGAVGDGVEDDTAAIQAALATGKDVFFPSGEYLISDSLVMSSRQRAIGDHGSSIVADFAGYAFETRGTATETTSHANAAISILDDFFSMTSAAELAVGDMIAIYDTALDVYEVNVVVHKVSSIVYLQYPVAQEFATVADIAILKVAPIEGASITGLKISNTSTSGVPGAVLWNLCRACSTTDCELPDSGKLSLAGEISIGLDLSRNTVTRSGKSGISLRVTHGCAIQNNLITDNRGDEPIVLFLSNTHTAVVGNRITQNARCTPGTGSANIQLDGLNFYNSVVGNTANGCPTYNLYLHNQSSYNTVVGNVLNDSLLGAIRVDAASHGNFIDGNVCTNILDAADPYLGGGSTYAIGIASGCNDNYVGPGNIIAGCAGGTISNLGTGGAMSFVLPAGTPTLTANYGVTFEYVSNTQLKVLMRGSDGTTRSVTLTLS